MNFEFFQPARVDEAIDLLARYGEGTWIISGGAALVPSIQQKLVEPRALISVTNIAELRFAREDAQGMHLGATSSLRSLAESAQIRQLYPALSTACGLVGNVRVRNQATIGGNLALADYASDPPAVLCALNATVTARNATGSRQIPLTEFFRGHNSTVLEPDELLTQVNIPGLPADTRQVYIKYKSRSGEDRPCVGAAAVASFQGEICTDLRVAVGGACPVPYRSIDLEHKARGHALDDRLIAEIAEGYALGIDAIEDLRGSAWYHRQVTRVFVRRALEEVRDGIRR